MEKAAQPALAADVARRGEKWLKLRFFVYGKMLTGRSPGHAAEAQAVGRNNEDMWEHKRRVYLKVRLWKI